MAAERADEAGAAERGVLGEVVGGVEDLVEQVVRDGDDQEEAGRVRAPEIAGLTATIMAGRAKKGMST
jgi:hypothetical protein